MSISTYQPFAGKGLYLFAGFCIGIVAGSAMTVSVPIIGAMTLGLLLVSVLMRNQDQTGAILIFMTAAFSGMLAVTIQISQTQKLAPPDELVNRLVTVAGTINGTPRIHDGTTTFVLDCDSLYAQGRMYHITGAIPSSLFGQEILVSEGDRVVFRGILRSDPQPVGNDDVFFSSSLYTGTYRITANPSTESRIVHVERGGMLHRIRRYVNTAIDRLPFGEHASVIKAVTIGDTRQLSPSVRHIFAQAGIAHLLAVSGLHASIIALAVSWVLRILHSGRRLSFLVMFVCLCVYAALCGFRPPVFRAALMSLMVMGGGLMGRPVKSEHVLSLAGLFILALNPLSLLGPSFQLSFAGVWSITTFHQPVTSFLRNHFTWYGPTHPGIATVCSLLIVSALATLGTAPIVAAHFGTIPILAIATNVLAIPLVFLIVYLAVGAVLLSPFGILLAPLTLVMAAGAGFLLRILNVIAMFAANVPFASLDVGACGLFTAVMAISWLFLLSRASGRTSVRRTLVYLPLICMTVIIWEPLVASSQYEHDPAIVFFDVGQGDAALIRTQDNAHYLVDTGTMAACTDIVLPGLKKLGVNKLDGLFVSHMDDDHAGGLAVLLDTLPVDQLYCREQIADSLQSAFTVMVTGLAAGDFLSGDRYGFSVLSPPPDDVFAQHGILDENNASLVFVYKASDISVMFTGDIEEETQHRIAAWEDMLASTVLKFPHHGAEPVNEYLLDMIHPSMVVISCGLNNRYRHPAEETLIQCDENGAVVLRTDRDGPFSITIRHEGLSIEPLSQ